MSGSEVVIVGGGVTGLSAGWWLARSGVKVTVLDKFIVGWEASGRNGGGASHYFSPLFAEEHRLWPQMDELLGYPTEHQKERILIAMSERQWEQYRFIAERHQRLGYPVDLLDVRQVQEAVPLAGDPVADVGVGDEGVRGAHVVSPVAGRATVYVLATAQKKQPAGCPAGRLQALARGRRWERRGTGTGQQRPMSAI